MKDYIVNKWGDTQLLYKELRVAVKEAWDAITVEQLDSLISSMRERCQDVIVARGGHTKW